MSKTPKSLKRRDIANLTLIPWPGNADLGYYVNISKTDWRGARNMSVPRETRESWSSALNDLTLYFPPLSKRFKFEGTTRPGAQVRYDCRFEGKHLMVNAVMKLSNGVDTRTMCLLFRDGKMVVREVPYCIQEASSSYYQEMYRAAMGLLKAPPEIKKQVFDGYMSEDVGQDYATTMSGYAGMQTEYNVRVLCTQSIVYDMFCLFKTLSVLDYAVQLGIYNTALISEQICVQKSTLYEVEARCAQCTTPVSGLRPTGGDPPFEGNSDEFLNLHKAVGGSQAVFCVIRNIARSDDVVQLDTLNEHAKENFFYIDQEGNPCDSFDFVTESNAIFACHALGVKSRFVGAHELYALFEHTNSKWVFMNSCSLPQLYNLLNEDIEGADLNPDIWSAIMVPSYQHKGKGLRFGEKERVCPGDNVPQYECAKEFLEALAPCSNINTLHDANTFIECFLRLLRRRIPEPELGTAYNTGLLGKNGCFIWIMVPNLQGPFYNLQPSLILDFQSAKDPILPYHDTRQLTLRPTTVITLDKDSFKHTIEERGFRMPDKVEGMTFDQLIHKIQSSIILTGRMLRSNPLWAQPMWSERDDKIYHMIPLYGDSISQDDLLGVLLVKNHRVATLYSVDIAKIYIPFIQSPPAQWLLGT